MGLPFVAGQRLTAADLNTATQQAAWTTYTPTWSSSGTQPVLGNGTIVGTYSKIGRLVTARVEINTGSTTTFGSGYYSVSLPFTASVAGIPSGQFAHAGAWVISTSGGSTFYTAAAMIIQNATGTVSGLINNSPTFLAATNPTTFSGAGCQFQCTITYESTS